MPASAAPITPAVLAWAVGEDGRDLGALSEALQVPLDTLDSWVQGEDRPSSGEVSRLAKVLRRPRALFFMPTPPVAATLPANFRHPPGADQEVSPSTRNVMRRAWRVQGAMSWVQRDDEDVDLPAGTTAVAPATAAAAVRDWLGISTTEQFSWTDDYQALRVWRATLDARRVLVFALKLGRGQVRGFSTWDDKAPLIVANTEGVNPAARIYTLMHELGHLYLRAGSACAEESYASARRSPLERWCEQFSACLLMPAPATRRWAAEREISHASLEDVSAMSRRFRVSAQAAALRLTDLGLAPPNLFAAVLRTFVPSPPRPDGQTPKSPPRFTLRRRQFGDRVIRAVVNDLPPRDALSVLRLEVADVRELAERVSGVEPI